MKTFTINLLLLLFTNLVFSQNIQLEFEDQTMTIGEHQILTGNDTINYSVTFFPSTWDTSFGGNWVNGWAWSSENDTLTPGFTNQYSSSNGTGADSSRVYLVSYSSSKILTPNQSPKKMYVNNSTYAHLSMKNGDSFAKKFGGVSGNDPDFFLLTIKGFKGGVQKDSIVEFYLADYRFTTNSLDYIINDWTEVDLSSIGETDSLEFSLTSSDNGAFGMNTPAYFCMDNYEYSISSVGISENIKNEMTVYPNPTTSILFIQDVQENVDFKIYNNVGAIVLSQENSEPKIDVSSLNNGMYTLQFSLNNRLVSVPFIKQ